MRWSIYEFFMRIIILRWKYFDHTRFECFLIGKEFFESNKKHYYYTKNNEYSAYTFARDFGCYEQSKYWFPKSIKKERREKLEKLENIYK